MSAPGTSSPFRADGRYEHAVMVAPPSESRHALERFQRPGLNTVGYIRVLALGVLAIGAASLLTDRGPGIAVSAGVVGVLFLWLAGRLAAQRRMQDARVDEAFGPDRHPCQLEREGFRLERPELSAEWRYDAVGRVAVIDRYVVVEVVRGEALMLEPKGDPEELAAWIRERAGGRRRIASWEALAMLAVVYGALCVAFVVGLFTG